MGHTVFYMHSAQRCRQKNSGTIQHSKAFVPNWSTFAISSPKMISSIYWISCINWAFPNVICPHIICFLNWSINVSLKTLNQNKSKICIWQHALSNGHVAPSRRTKHCSMAWWSLRKQHYAVSTVILIVHRETNPMHMKIIYFRNVSHRMKSRTWSRQCILVWSRRKNQRWASLRHIIWLEHLQVYQIFLSSIATYGWRRWAKLICCWLCGANGRNVMHRKYYRLRWLCSRNIRNYDATHFYLASWCRREWTISRLTFHWWCILIVW